MSLRVLKGNPWHTPRNRRPVCRACAQPASWEVVEARPIFTMRPGRVERSVEIHSVYYCDKH